MRSAIIFYSYTGNTRKVAQELQQYLEKQGSVELIELKALDESRSFLGQCRRAFFKQEAKIEDVQCDLSGFNLVCFGTPVWAFGPAPAMNTYLKKCSGLEDTTTAVFTTFGSGMGNGKCIKKIQQALRQKGAKKFCSFSIQQFKVDNKNYILDVVSKAL